MLPDSSFQLLARLLWTPPTAEPTPAASPVEPACASDWAWDCSWLIGSTLPALSVVALPDVPATPTPPETAWADGYPPRRRRPSSSHQRLGDSGSILFRGSLAVVHLHSGPSVLCLDCLIPSPPCGGDRHQAV